MARKKRDAFEVALSPDQEKELTDWLATEIEYALMARSTIVGDNEDLDYFYELYEGGDRKIVRDSPWPGACNTHSTLGMEKVDALRSRIMKTIFVEPVCVVEGWGRSAARAPFVEEFHQWKQEEERLQRYLGKTVHAALITGTGVLECYEYAECRKQRREMDVYVAMNENGSPRLTETGEPILARDERGDLIPADEADTQTPIARAIMDGFVTTKRGPRYRVVPLRDFLALPGHALDVDQVWGWGKRFWRRLPELQEREKAGFYRNVERLGEEGERTQLAADTRKDQQIAPQYGPTAEKELWEVLFLRDLDDDGVEEWYLATLHKDKRVLLRLQRDKLGRSHYILLVPFPRDDSVYGYSYIGHKLGSLVEEHTITGRQITDRATLVNAAPLKRVQGALWDPQEQPFGPLAVLDVRDPNEVQAMIIPDVPASLVNREQNTERRAEAASGISDLVVGVQASEDRTLGENQLAASGSFVRIDEVIHNVQESIEDLYELRHILWIRALEEQDGEDAPARLMKDLTLRGLQLENGKFTADLLRGKFRWKPRGSVETADPMREQANFNRGLAVATKLPGAQQKFQDPRVVRAVWEEFVRVYRIRDRQAFLGQDPESAPLETMAEGVVPNGGQPAGAGGPGGAGSLGGMAALLGALRPGVGAGGVPEEGPGGAGAVAE